ncbi:hypothetical protein, partial [Pseudomonas syringae group genomosp. 7]|uniref:hypothetical protein n=1 Tax=Pseudomonas syringae group genomosp. 7 TaxID=251699 RepID=UPI00376F6F81
MLLLVVCGVFGGLVLMWVGVYVVGVVVVVGEIGGGLGCEVVVVVAGGFVGVVGFLVVCGWLVVGWVGGVLLVLALGVLIYFSIEMYFRLVVGRFVFDLRLSFVCSVDQIR